MTKTLGLAFALAWAIPTNAAGAVADPVVRIDDIKPLQRMIHFGRPDPALKGLPAGEILWRINVDLPSRVSLGRVEMLGYAPINLHFTDGRCFELGMDSGGRVLRAAPLAKHCVSQAPARSLPEPLPRPGMRYVGRAWDLSAWTDKASGKTMLFRDREPQREPVLTTSIKVLGVGGIASPDTPMTEVSLVGYVGRQLTVATVMLYLP